MTTRERVTAYLAQHPHSTSQQIAANLGVDTSSVRTYLRELKSRGVLGQQCRWLSQHGYTREYHLTERELDASDVDACLTLRSVHGVLFRGIVSGIANTGTWHLVNEINAGGEWKQLKPAELRLVRGAIVVE